MKSTRRTFLAAAGATPLLARSATAADRRGDWNPIVSENLHNVEYETLRWLKQLGLKHAVFQGNGSCRCERQGLLDEGRRPLSQEQVRRGGRRVGVDDDSDRAVYERTVRPGGARRRDRERDPHDSSDRRGRCADDGVALLAGLLLGSPRRVLPAGRPRRGESQGLRLQPRHRPRAVSGGRARSARAKCGNASSTSRSPSSKPPRRPTCSSRCIRTTRR